MDFGPAYGHWLLVTVNAFLILVFAFSFFRPRTRRDWRTFGAFSGFVIALFTEMYGFPLTIYLMSGFLIQWPTLPTLIMFPVLVFIYVRLANREEQESSVLLDEVYVRYAGQVPRFIPRIRRTHWDHGPCDVDRSPS